ncbi:MAG TPA: ATP-binding cassette domain-containing protein [Clostridiales bacterium]|nr:ATP-binding cassette domain-containing protein [Clostridiales bacterium]
MVKIRDLKKEFSKYSFSIECRHLDVETGSSLGISGTTGSGKTLFTKIITGLAGSYSGSVEIAGTELKKIYRKKLGYVPFKNILYGNLTLKENSRFLLSRYRTDPQDYRIKMDWFSEFWDIRRFDGLKISELTDGQLQTVKIFSGLLHSPAVLVIDEPFNGLGSGSANRLRDLFTDIGKREVTVIAASSSSDLLSVISGRTVQILNGKIE